MGEKDHDGGASFDAACFSDTLRDMDLKADRCSFVLARYFSRLTSQAPSHWWQEEALAQG
jgi:hypothetical protein